MRQKCRHPVTIQQLLAGYWRPFPHPARMVDEEGMGIGVVVSQRKSSAAIGAIVLRVLRVLGAAGTYRLASFVQI
jgi:hypothetical protein